jgi:hypothetical protein
MVAYHRHFIKQYMQFEERVFRLIQLPLEQVEEMEQNKEIEEGLGYRYEDMVKFHVDEHPFFQDRMSTTEYGGDLSIRKPADVKSLVCFGQDECIFKQFTFTPKAWTAPGGQKAMIPKDEGLGVMISAFVSREFIFGYCLSPQDLQKVNKEREGKHYSDKDAAKKINVVV